MKVEQSARSNPATSKCTAVTTTPPLPRRTATAFKELDRW